MAMCRAVWPEDRANKPCHSVRGDRTGCHQPWLRVLHSLRAGQGLLAAEGFQQASKPSEMQQQGRQFPLPGTESIETTTLLFKVQPNSRTPLTRTEHFFFFFTNAFYTFPSKSSHFLGYQACSISDLQTKEGIAQ